MDSNRKQCGRLSVCVGWPRRRLDCPSCPPGEGQVRVCTAILEGAGSCCERPPERSAGPLSLSRLPGEGRAWVRGRSTSPPFSPAHLRQVLAEHPLPTVNLSYWTLDIGYWLLGLHSTLGTHQDGTVLHRSQSRQHSPACRSPCGATFPGPDPRQPWEGVEQTGRGDLAQLGFAPVCNQCSQLWAS